MIKRVNEVLNVKRTLKGLLVPVGLAATVVGCEGVRKEPPQPLPAPAIAAAAKPAADVFLAGDSLELFVEEDPSFNGTYPVREGGYVLIPRIGRVHVMGMDRQGAEGQLTQALQRGQLAKARVLVERIKGVAAGGAGAGSVLPGVPKIMVYFTGSVSKPGMHALPLINGKPMGTYEALLISGGLSKFGTLGKVEILRPSASGRRTRIVVDLRPIRDGSADDPPLGEGDIVNVSEKVFGF